MPSYTIEDSVTVSSPLRALDVLTSKDGAKVFRDIGKYTHYQDSGKTVQVEYPSRIPFAGPVRLEFQRCGSTLLFTGTGPLGIEFQGKWTIRIDGRVTLHQTISGPVMYKGMVHRRTARALEDLHNAC